MFVLRKTSIILTIIILTFVVLGFLFCDDKENIVVEEKEAEKIKKVIVVDAGHGKPDGGAVSKSGVAEEEINLKIALKLKDLLEKSDYVVILTRSDENGIYDEGSKSIREKKISDLKNRVEIGNNSNAEIFISIHLNKIKQEKYSGHQTFYQNDNESSKELAFYIQDNLNFAVQKENKREILPLKDVYIMDNLQIPTVLVECGFLSNINEAKLLENEDYQMRLAWGIYLGIMDYFYE